jgi:YidC/Oxa1 family membrane protein insertase
MENFKFFLLALLATLSYALWQNWQMDYNEAYRKSLLPQTPDVSSTAAETQSDTSVIAGEIPDRIDGDALVVGNTTVNTVAATDALQKSQRIQLTTDVYSLEIDTTGGDIRILELLKYPKTKQQQDIAIRILNDDANQTKFFVAQSGLIGSEYSLAPTHRDQFEAQSLSYTLAEGKDFVEIPLVWNDPSGLQVTKTYRFHRGSYEIDVEQTITNNTANISAGQQYVQLQSTGLTEDYKSFFVS